MESLISIESLSLLKRKSEEVKIQLKILLEKFSNNDIKVGVSVVDNVGYLAVILEAYFLTANENDYGLILSITFQKRNDIVEGEFSISKESGEFILSPRTFDIYHNEISNDFFVMLNEYYNVFELLLKNYLLDQQDYIAAYQTRW